MFHYSYEPYNGDSPLHPFDYPYFHKNIRINVNERVNSFFEKKVKQFRFCLMKNVLNVVKAVIVGIKCLEIFVCHCVANYFTIAINYITMLVYI